jgi:putative endopeptidase
MIHNAIKMVPIAAIVLLTACKTDKNKGVPKPLTSGVLTQNMDTLVKPGDDFDAYVNGSWVKHTEIPADKSSYGAAYMLYEEAEENVKKIIEESASGAFEKGSEEQKVGDLYESYMDMETRNAIGAAPLMAEFLKIDALQNYDDLAVYFAYAIKNGIKVPINFFINPDFKDPTIYAVFTVQSGLGLPDREYYLKTDARSEEIKTKYLEHLEKMFTLAKLPNAKTAAQTVMAVETSLAKKHLEKEKSRDWVNLYNMIPIDSLGKAMPRFNWSGFLKEAGLDKQQKLGILMLEYTKALDKIITATAMEAWKTYLKWGVIDANASRLDAAFDEQNWSFYSKELRGIEEQRPLWRRGVAIVNGTLGEVVGKVYVKKHFPPEAKERMEKLVQNLLKAYEHSIKELDWMSDATKKEALDKLSMFTPKIGYPDKWKTYDVDIKSNDLFGNLARAGIMEYDRELAKLGKPIDKQEWGMTPQTVNAYYNPTMNEIVFPAAILQPPFFDLNADDAINYGAIGSVIGHEIGHGFDNRGSTFDGSGALRDWWTDIDKENFEKRTEALVVQYDQFKVFPDLNVNGEFTLGENIGDLGGLSIALSAYKMSLNGREAPVLNGFTGNQRVFIGFAQAFCNKSRDEALRVQVNTDPHAPNHFRINGVVRNVPEFYSAFNVQEQDSLYLPPSERIKIW